MQQTIERILRLMDLMNSNVNYSIDDLARRTGLSKRTIQRYICTIREAGLEVSSGSGGLHITYPEGISPEMKYALHLSEEETETLIGMLEDNPGDSPEIIQGILKKINGLKDK